MSDDISPITIGCDALERGWEGSSSNQFERMNHVCHSKDVDADHCAFFLLVFFTHPARVCAERNRKKTAPHPTAESDMKFFCFKILVFELSNIQNSNTSFYAPCWYKTAPSLLLCLYVKQFQSCQSFEIRKSDAENRNGHDL